MILKDVKNIILGVLTLLSLSCSNQVELVGHCPGPPSLFPEEQSYLVQVKNFEVLDGLPQSHIRERFTEAVTAVSLTGLNSQQLQKLRQLPGVLSVEPNQRYSVLGCPAADPPLNIPHPGDFQEFLPPGISRAGGPLSRTNHRAWIIDTGIDLQSRDLVVNEKLSVSFIDNEEEAQDHHGHGTHVGGTVAAIENNELVVGISPGSELVGVKALNRFGFGTTEGVVQAVEYVGKHAQPGDVVNMSLGGSPSDILDEAIIEVASRGIYFSVAAGNSTLNTKHKSPARIQHSNVFVVAASTSEDCMVYFSNFGESVDFAARGKHVLSLGLDNTMTHMSGTSMAAPHVTGLLLFGIPNHDGLLKCYEDSRQEEYYLEPIAHF